MRWNARIECIGSLVFAGLICVTLSSCWLAPSIDSIQRAGVNVSGRQKLLSETLTDFHHALFWGSTTEAMDFVSPAKSDELRILLKSHRKLGRVVESNVEFVDFSSDAYAADVEVTEKFHDFATNSLNTRLELEKWEYSFNEGWKLISRERGEG